MFSIRSIVTASVSTLALAFAVGCGSGTDGAVDGSEIDTNVDETTARRAAQLRFLSRRGSAVDAIVVAVAEPDGRVLTGDPEDLEALAGHADHVLVETI